MDVKVIAYTTPDYSAIDMLAEAHMQEVGSRSRVDDSPYLLEEFAGRTCYLSYDRPNPKTFLPYDYVQNIIKQKHESVLEHSSVTFFLSGVSRSLTHELVRHRHLSFSQVSQRYTEPLHVANKSGMEMLPPDLEDIVKEVYQHAEDIYESVWAHLYYDEELPNKKAREVARMVLPSMTETRIVVTGNLRAWRDMLRKRLSPTADQEIRQCAIEILRELYEMYPAIFEDLVYDFDLAEELEPDYDDE